MSLNTTSQTQEAITALDTLVKQNGALIEELQSLNALKDNHILTYSINGFTFVGGYVPSSVAELVTNLSQIISIKDNTLGYFGVINTQSVFSNLEEVEFPNATSMANAETLSRSSKLKKVSIPNVITGSTNLCVVDTALVYLNVLNMETIGGSFVILSTRLIDLVIGAGFTGSRNLQYWDPTEALLSNSTSLLTQEDIANGFTSNREKLLYNIREHFAANLPDRTGLSAWTLALSANIKAAIQADTTTSNAFTNKNWIIA